MLCTRNSYKYCQLYFNEKISKRCSSSVNIFLVSLHSSYSILNTSSSNTLSFGDGILERRQYEDQGLGDSTPLTIICQPTQVGLTIRATSSTLLRSHWAPVFFSQRVRHWLLCPERVTNLSGHTILKNRQSQMGGADNDYQLLGLD